MDDAEPELIEEKKQDILETYTQAGVQLGRQWLDAKNWILWGVGMSEFMKLAIVFISMLVLFYFLWVNGYMILNAKRALLFVVSLRGKNKCEVSFSSCSGYVKKVIKFNESR